MALPNIRNKPTYKDLLEALNSLEIKPRSWDDKLFKDVNAELVVNENDVRNFLLCLFKSDFSWFENTADENLTAQEQKEEIVDMASRRFAERCGRTARGQDTRTFRLEVTRDLNIGLDDEPPAASLELRIREPPLTGDNLGLKTWGSAWTMVRLLPKLGQYPPLQKLLDRQRQPRSGNGHCTEAPRLQVLELGAGTGLVGMAAAALWGVTVVLTDLPVIHENLLYNVDKNMPVISRVSNGQAFAEILDWNYHGDALRDWPSKEFEVILAVDPLYDDDHPEVLASTIKQFSKRGRGHFVLTAVPLRDNTTELLCLKLEKLMQGNGFENVQGGENVCRDDWESANSSEVMVKWVLWLGPDWDL